ncbi:MAG: hypothetical protein ACPGXK_11610 [Phycisphaerae bacterium]
MKNVVCYIRLPMLCFGMSCFILSAACHSADEAVEAIAEQPVEAGAAGAIECADDALIVASVQHLLEMQQADGSWPYEGVYRVRGEIPVGYRVGGTASAATALLHAGREQADVRISLHRAIEFILKGIERDELSMSRRDRYDVRIWGQSTALSFLSQWLLFSDRGPQEPKVRVAVDSLVDRIVKQEIRDGGWNYANQRYPASFVTGPVAQSLLWARATGARVPDAVLERAGDALLHLQHESGAVHYSGSQAASRRSSNRATVPGSAARAPVCATTLYLLGKGDLPGVLRAVELFFANWQALEDRRQQTGTHEGPYGVAPYYFFFGHRYAAQAISALPKVQQAEHEKRLCDLLLRVRDDDGTWNDRIFRRSRNYGTAMALIAILGDGVPLPPPLSAGE